MQCLALLLLSALAIATLFPSSELPLKVVSITPEAGQLYGTQPLTVVFSRPLVALGDDITSPPFFLRAKQGEFAVPSKVRLVTTYIVRLDPDVPWPPNLQLELLLNRDLTTFDGVRLAETPSPVSYFTGTLTMFLASVTSKRAEALTNGMWTADSAFEIPPDGVAELTFGYEVDSTLIQQCFSTTPAVQLFWASCPSKNCLRFTTSALTVGASYNLTLKEGCVYHNFAGPLAQSLTASFSGLLPFRFPFNPTSPLKYRRYELWLRHGLQANVTMSQLEAAMSLTTGNTPVAFSLLDPRPQPAVLRLNAQFQPGRRYRLSFAASPSILDGFDLPLQQHSTEFTTAPLPVTFVTLQDPFVVLEPPSVPWFHAALVQGTDATSRVEDVYTVSPASTAQALWHQQRGTLCGAACGTKIGQLRSGATGFSIQRFPMSNSSALYLREQESIPATFNEAKFISVTDLSVTAIARTTSPTYVQVFVWVTRMSTGLPVEGATVTLYGGGRTSVEAEAAGLTTAEGVAELAFVPSQQSPSLSVSVVLRNEVAVLNELGYYATYYTPASQLTGSFVTDLGIYRPQDPVRLKGYVRVLGRTKESWVLAPNVTLHVCFELKAADWATQTPEQWITTPVVLDPTFGSFDAEFVLPAEVKSGEQRIELRAYEDSSLKSFTTISSTLILVADPRRPTAVLSVTTTNEVYVPGETILVTVKTTTGSDIPIGGVNVTLLWSLASSGGSRATMFIRATPSTQPTQGTVFVVTDATGTGTATLRIPQAQVGDSISVSGSWVGPTGELLKEDLPVLPVSESPWLLDMNPSISKPLPGFPFGVYLDLKTRQGVKLTGKTVTLRLREISQKASPVVKTCTAVTNGAVSPSCTETMLPAVGKYELSGTVVDAAGRQLTSSLSLGSSQEEWNLRPLSSFDAVSLRLDKETYAVGDTAQVSLQSPFSNATLLLRWTSSINRAKPKSMFVTLPTSGRYSIPFPIGAECLRSCQLIAVVSISRQSSFALPVPIPISHLWDPQQPRSIIESLFVSVPDTEREVSVKLSLAQPFVLPGDNVTGTVEVPPSSGAVEVAIFAVDRAYLELRPHPLKNFSQEFAIQQAGSSFSATDNRHSLIPLKALVDTVSVFANRNAADPWIDPTWPARPSSWATADVDLPDERVFSSHTSCITSFPSGCPSESLLYNFDNRWGFDFTDLPSAINIMRRDVNFARPFEMKAGAFVAPSDVVASAGPTVRTNMNPSPLFIRRLVIPANSTSTSFDFMLPDDIGTFVVRAYVTTADTHRFGAAEASVVARRSISLEARLPRLVRLGDNFTAGVVVESVSTRPRNITVNASSFSSALTLDSDSVVIESKQGPVSASFGMRAVALSAGSPLKFVASVSSAPVDALQVPLRVLGTQSAVHVATSMALHSVHKGSWTWSEGLHLPAAVPGSGSLNLTLGVGRLPVINAIAQLLGQASLTGEVAVAQAAIKAAYAKYAVPPPAEMLEAANKELRAFSNALGLRYSKDDIGSPNGRLNALALQLALFLQLSNNTLPDDLTGLWRAALKQDLIRQAEDSKKYSNRPFSDWQLLADAFFGLGPQVEDMHPDLTLSRLLAALPSCSIATKLSLAMSFVLRSLAVPSQLANLNQELLNVMRVQGRYLYVSESRAVASAATGSTQALALLFMARQNSNSALTVEKLANWVAAGNGNSAGCGYSFGAGVMSITAIALADYDAIRGSNNPSLQVLVKNGGVLLLSGEFYKPEAAVKSATLAWEDLNAPSDPLVFTGQGAGEVSVALGLDFIPRAISADPVFRGLFVEKVIRRLDAKGQPTGGGLQLVESGALVQICVQVTSPDDVRSLVIEDLSCGGLEPLESSPSLTLADVPAYGWWRWFNPLGNSRQVRSDRVSWNSAYVTAGSNTVCYNAVANIPGVYTLPPAKAFSSPEPELMGLSAGGVFVVSDGPVADVAAELKRLNVALVERLTPKSCGQCTSPYQYCNVRLGTCAYYQAYAGLAPQWQPSLLTASSAQIISPLFALCISLLVL